MTPGKMPSPAQVNAMLAESADMMDHVTGGEPETAQDTAAEGMVNVKPLLATITKMRMWADVTEDQLLDALESIPEPDKLSGEKLLVAVKSDPSVQSRLYKSLANVVDEAAATAKSNLQE